MKFSYIELENKVKNELQNALSSNEYILKSKEPYLTRQIYVSKRNFINSAFNNKYGVYLKTFYRVPIVAWNNFYLIRNEISQFHVGRLCVIFNKDNYFEAYPLYFQGDNGRLFIRTYKKYADKVYKFTNNVLFLDAFDDYLIGIISGNYTTGYKPSNILFKELLSSIECIFIEEGDLFAVPYIGSVIDFTNVPDIGDRVFIGNDGKWKADDNGPFICSYIDSQLMWLFYVENIFRKYLKNYSS